MVALYRECPGGANIEPAVRGFAMTTDTPPRGLPPILWIPLVILFTTALVAAFV